DSRSAGGLHPSVPGRPRPPRAPREVARSSAGRGPARGPPQTPPGHRRACEEAAARPPGPRAPRAAGSSHAAAPRVAAGLPRERAVEELARANPVAERVVVHADSVETLPFIPLGLNLLRERQGAIEQTQRRIETTDGVVCERRVIDHEEVQFGIGLFGDILAR